MIQKVLLTIVTLVIGLILAANILPDTVTEATTSAYTENYDVDTGVGETSTSETLSYDHYYEDLTELTATSDNENDSPTVMSYNEDTRSTTVGGLEASASRILSIAYVREAYQQFTGFSSFIRLIPFITIVGLVIAAIWGLFSHVKNR